MSLAVDRHELKRDVQLIGDNLSLRFLDAAVAEVQTERSHLDASLGQPERDARGVDASREEHGDFTLAVQPPADRLPAPGTNVARGDLPVGQPGIDLLAQREVRPGARAGRPHTPPRGRGAGAGFLEPGRLHPAQRKR